MSQITDEVTVLDAGSQSPLEGPTACCKTGPILAVIQPEE